MLITVKLKKKHHKNYCICICNSPSKNNKSNFDSRFDVEWNITLANTQWDVTTKKEQSPTTDT